MTDFDEKKVLQRATRLRVDMEASSGILIWVNNKVVSAGAHGLMVLDAFREPISVSKAMQKLRGRSAGMQDWIDLMSTIVAFYEAGVLEEQGRVRPSIESDDADFSSAPIHLAMLNDRRRTSSFLTAIREVVSPGDIVLDIGTGTGILAIAAAQAGAKHVYAIEAARISESAKALFEANGLADRITLIQGQSTQVTLPEPADVLVSETIGTEPLEERALEVTRDAVKRLLKRGARLLPSKIKILGRPVTIPDSTLSNYTFTTKTLRQWKQWYRIDFSPLAEIAQGSICRFAIPGGSARRWKFLSGPVVLAEVDFKKARHLRINRKANFTSETEGKLNGLVVHFDLELSPKTHLSTDPLETNRKDHWGNPVWMLPEELLLKRGDSFQVTYRYGGMRTELSCKLRA